MSKIVMRLHLLEPKVRKRAVRVVQKHKDKTKYTRKCKHKATGFGGLSCSSRGMTVFYSERLITTPPASSMAKEASDLFHQPLPTSANSLPA